ncbi:MAG: peptide chain release factor N(5)-glutamine methyltransferase [Lachnospiraceae bacterium]|nr:peptide chain release factor N(5)-glutamine methyltransferase [Lachnospiraceae bacterium]
MTYRDVKCKAAARLRAAGIENEAAESAFLLEHACGTDLNFYLLHQAEEMPREKENRFFQIVEKRCKRIPLQHLTGVQEFMGLPFFVNEHVLIPSQYTELLVEEAVRVLRGELDDSIFSSPNPDMSSVSGNYLQEKYPISKFQDFHILDLCTGSGCIAISLKSFFRHAFVCGTDISAEALKLAGLNAAANRVDITFIESDLFSDVSGKFHMIVSNPPYIPSAEIPALMPEVRDYEPHLALDGDRDGLAFYRRITAECPDYLLPGGYLLFEIGFDQGEAVSALMREKGFEDIEVIQDLAGLDRVVRGKLP